MEKQTEDLALFDFDKTITNRDTFFHFMSYACRKTKVILVIFRLFPYVILHFAGFIDGGKLKELFLKRLVGGWTVGRIEEIAAKYTSEKLGKIIRSSALEEIRKHKDKGADVAIVSASPSVWIKFFAQEQGVDLIATELELIDDIVTGRLKGKNCRGKEKVERIKKKYDLSKYRNIFAYGDSSGDKEMLELANHKYYKAFK